MACSTKAGASRWIGRKWFVAEIKKHKQDYKSSPTGISKKKIHNKVQLLTYVTLLINRLTNNIHNASKCSPTNRHLQRGIGLKSEIRVK